jgi:aryl-alcohol dehydrogenase-like predicted oxidoreductase
MTFGEQNSEQEGHDQLDFALDQGVNFIDTAELYAVPTKPETQGSTEKIIGSWIAKRKRRDDFILASKITGPSPNLTYIRKPLHVNPEQIQIALEGSLRRLQTDYLDLYQLHWPERHTNYFGNLGYKYSPNDPWIDNFHEVLDCLQGLVKEGKIRSIGISNETPWGFARFNQLSEQFDLPKMQSVQNPYNLLNRTYEVGMAEMSIRNRAGLLAYSPMAFGMLSGKYHKSEKPKDGRLTLYPHYNRYNGKRSLKATEAYLKLAKESGLTLAQMSLAFVNQQPFLTSNIIGATKMSQLKENIASVNINLEDDLIKAINKVHERNPNPAP